MGVLGGHTGVFASLARLAMAGPGSPAACPAPQPEHATIATVSAIVITKNAIFLIGWPAFFGAVPILIEAAGVGRVVGAGRRAPPLGGSRHHQGGTGALRARRGGSYPAAAGSAGTPAAGTALTRPVNAPSIRATRSLTSCRSRRTSPTSARTASSSRRRLAPCVRITGSSTASRAATAPRAPNRVTAALLMTASVAQLRPLGNREQVRAGQVARAGTSPLARPGRRRRRPIGPGWWPKVPPGPSCAASRSASESHCPSRETASPVSVLSAVLLSALPLDPSGKQPPRAVAARAVAVRFSFPKAPPRR